MCILIVVFGFVSSALIKTFAYRQPGIERDEHLHLSFHFTSLIFCFPPNITGLDAKGRGPANIDQISH